MVVHSKYICNQLTSIFEPLYRYIPYLVAVSPLVRVSCNACYGTRVRYSHLVLGTGITFVRCNSPNLARATKMKKVARVASHGAQSNSAAEQQRAAVVRVLSRHNTIAVRGTGSYLVLSCQLLDHIAISTLALRTRSLAVCG